MKHKMWKEEEIVRELEDARKVVRICGKEKDIGSIVYWSGYVRALEVILNKKSRN